MDLVELSDFSSIISNGIGQVDTLDVLWLQPFPNNQNIHPPEEGKEEKEHGDKLEVEVEHIAEVETVKSFHNDTD